MFIHLPRIARSAVKALALSISSSFILSHAIADNVELSAQSSNAVSPDQEHNAESTPFDPADLPEVLKNLERHGVDIVGPMPMQGGLRAYAGITQQQPLAIYLTPDSKNVIIGTMMDEEGSDITSVALEEATLGPWTQRTWAALQASRWVLDGNKEAPRVIYMITDPNCPFCHKFWQQSRPWVESGKVQIRHILVGVLTPSSAGKAAAILGADDPSKALSEHENSSPDAGIEALEHIPSTLLGPLEQNRLLMEELQIQGTPGIFYFDNKDELQIQRGAPLDEHLEQILGAR